MAVSDITAGEMRAFRTYMQLETHEKAAEALGISTQTLKNHLGAVYKKLGRHKAHSALYKMSMDLGFNPFDAANPTPPEANLTAPLTDSWSVRHNDTDEAAI